MKNHCITAEELDVVVSGSADPGRRAHLEECAACRALVAEYRCFLAADPVPGARPKEAPPAFEDILAGSGDSPGPARPGTRDSWWRALTVRFPWRPVLAAATLAVAGIILLTPHKGIMRQDPSGIMRGADADSSVFQLAVSPADVPDSWNLRWPALAEAESYRLEVLDGDLQVILARDCSAAHEAHVARKDLPDTAPPPFFVRVIALKHAAESARTPLRELPPSP